MLSHSVNIHCDERLLPLGVKAYHCTLHTRRLSAHARTLTPVADTWVLNLFWSQVSLQLTNILIPCLLLDPFFSTASQLFATPPPHVAASSRTWPASLLQITCPRRRMFWECDCGRRAWLRPSSKWTTSFSGRCLFGLDFISHNNDADGQRALPLLSGLRSPLFPGAPVDKTSPPSLPVTLLSRSAAII